MEYTHIMSIWDRLGTVIKSYINDDDETLFGKSTRTRHSDPDIDAAYEELDGYLRGENGREKSGEGKAEKETAGKRKRPDPEELKKDFRELGLGPEATAAECKAAYKKLLKMHHPDRHAGNPENIKKATEKAANVNAAYERLDRWFKAFDT